MLTSLVRVGVKSYSLIYFFNIITLVQWCSIVLKELDNGDYSSELNAVNQAQAKLYKALKALETD